MSDELCPTCYNVRTVSVRPDQKGWLRRPERESERERYAKVHVYELPEGELYALPDPYMLRVPCPTCRPRRPSENPLLSFFKKP